MTTACHCRSHDQSTQHQSLYRSLVSLNKSSAVDRMRGLFQAHGLNETACDEVRAVKRCSTRMNCTVSKNMVLWYGMEWYGMDSLNVRCTFVDKCAAPGAPPAQCALASALPLCGQHHMRL